MEKNFRLDIRNLNNISFQKYKELYKNIIQLQNKNELLEKYLEVYNDSICGISNANKYIITKNEYLRRYSYGKLNKDTCYSDYKQYFFEIIREDIKYTFPNIENYLNFIIKDEFNIIVILSQKTEIKDKDLEWIIDRCIHDYLNEFIESILFLKESLDFLNENQENIARSINIEISNIFEISLDYLENKSIFKVTHMTLNNLRDFNEIFIKKGFDITFFEEGLIVDKLITLFQKFKKTKKIQFLINKAFDFIVDFSSNCANKGLENGTRDFFYLIYKLIDINDKKALELLNSFISKYEVFKQKAYFKNDKFNPSRIKDSKIQDNCLQILYEFENILDYLEEIKSTKNRDKIKALLSNYL